MNTWPTLKEWTHFGGVLGLEILILFAVARLATWRVRSAQGCRVIWQIALMAMLLAVVGELNGVRAVFRSPESPTVTPPPRAVVVTFPDQEIPQLLPLEFEEASLSVTPLAAEQMSPWHRHNVWPGVIWLAGAALLLSRGLLAQIIAIVFRLRLPSVKEPRLRERAERIRHALGIRRPVGFVERSRATVPFTFGIWKPVVVLPRGFTTKFSPEQQEAVLAHELAHVAGFDSGWRGVGGLLCVLLWWHPAAWLAKRELVQASELVADQASLLAADGPKRLAETLLVCANAMRTPALISWLGVDGGEFRSALGKRIARLMHLRSQEPVGARVPWYLRLLAPVTVVALMWTAMALTTNPSTSGASPWRNSILGSALAAAEPPPTSTTNASSGVRNLSDTPHLGRFLQPTNAVNDQAALPATTDEVTRRLLLDGKFYYENGRMDQARRTFLEALQIEPANQTAQYYLGLVDARTCGETQLPPPNAQRQQIYNKLRQTRLPEWGPIDNLPLSELVRQLTQEMRRRDPEGKGVNFMIQNPAPKAEHVDPATGLPRSSYSYSVDASVVRLGSLLRDISFEDALMILTNLADPPIRYSVEDFGVVFSARAMASAALHTRFFRVDPVSFQQALNSMLGQAAQGKARSAPGLSPRGATNNFTAVEPAETLIPKLRTWFNSLGVDVTEPGEALFFNDRLGTLMVRATLGELDTIEQGLQFLNMSPPQITLRVKVLEVTAAQKERVSRLASVRTNTTARGDFTNQATVTGILTDTQFREMVRTLESSGASDLLSAPEVTTISGRQAQIKVVDVRYIVTDLSINTNRKTGEPEISPMAEPFEIGPIVDLIPYVEADGYTIQITASPSVKEFLGYEDPSTVKPPSGGVVQASGVSSPVPLPKFRVRQAATTARIFDGQTLLISAGEVRDVQKNQGADGNITTNSTVKELFFFITPRIIDPTGRPTHSDEQLRAMHQRTPAQSVR